MMSETQLVVMSRRRVDFVILFAVAVAFAAAFLPTILELIDYWWEHSEYSHGFLMPMVAGWILWDRRAQLAQLRPTPSLVAVGFLLLCLLLLTLGEMKLSWFLKPYALAGALAALLWAFYGFRAVRLSFPALVALLLMCPLPGRVQNALTVPLKNSAAVFATGLLDVTGIPVSLEGNLIRLPGLEGLWVADACSGISSLISLVSLAVLASLFWKVPLWLRAVVVASAVPIAVLVNGVRIWLTGWISIHYDPAAAEGFFHFFEGVVLFLVGGGLLLAWAALLTKLYTEVTR